jgi:hypothetical protein
MPSRLLLSLPLLFGATLSLILPSASLALSPRPAGLSASLQRQVISAMQRDLGGNAASFKISQTESATWQDCVTQPSRPNPISTCQPIRKTGHKVRVTGLGQTWTYYVTPEAQITLDGPTSVSPKASQTLIRALGYDPKTPLKILAARPFSLLKACTDSSPSQPCNPAPTPYWLLLVEQHSRPIAIDLQGRIIQPEPGSLTGFLPKNLAGLSSRSAKAVLKDVIDRNLGTLPPNLRVESIKPTTWAMCDSGGVPVSGPGPSRPIVGACPVGVSSGWQMITRSGPVRWVHYVQPWPLTDRGGTLSHQLSPDGPQSLPKATADAVIQAAAQREQQTRDQYYIHWADSHFFDACLNPPAQFHAVNSALFCRQGLQSGWQVQVMTRGTTGPRLLVYHASLTGNDIRFVSANDWFPPPMATPRG